MTRRGIKWIAAGVVAPIALAAVLLAAILIGANTDPGRRLIETLTADLSGGTMRIEGLDGLFPSDVSVRRVTVADAAGTWLTIEDAVLDWSPRTLLRGAVAIDRLDAQGATIVRLPRTSSNGSGGLWVPPIGVAVSRLEVGRLEVGADVAGRAMALNVEGSGEFAPRRRAVEARLAAVALGRPGDPAPASDFRDDAGRRGFPGRPAAGSIVPQVPAAGGAGSDRTVANRSGASDRSVAGRDRSSAAPSTAAPSAADRSAAADRPADADRSVAGRDRSAAAPSAAASSAANPSAANPSAAGYLAAGHPGNDRPIAGRDDQDPPTPDRYGLRSMDRYTAHVSGDLAHLSATLDVVEAPGGAIAGIARLPDLGGLSIAASVDGPIGALATKAAIEAGQLRARLDGTLDIAALGANLSFSVVAPAMAPRQGIAWSSIRLTGAMHGPFNAPEASGMLAVDGLIAEGATIGTLRAAVSGSAGGDTTLHASLDGLRVPGPSPDILGGGPLTLDATARMGAVGRPVRFAVRHKVFSADGTADTAGVGSARIEVALPDLAPFAPFDGIDAHGHAVVDAGATRSGSTTDVTAKAEIGIDNAASLGTFLVPGLIGDTGTIDLAASLHGDDIRLSHLTFKGSAFDGSASGQLVDRKVDLDWAVSLPDMHVFRPAIAGAISAHGHLGGSPEALALTGDAAGDISAGAGEHLEPFAAHLTIAGLPNSPAGRLTASGSILNAPLWLAIDAERPNGGLRIVVDRAAWKSLNASGTLDFAPGADVPTGNATLTMTRLADLAPLLGGPVAGSVVASLDASSGVARVRAALTDAAVPGAGTVGKAALEATIADPAGHPAIDGVLTVDRAAASGTSAGIGASARLTGKGPLDALAFTLSSEIAGLPGAPARIETSGIANAVARTLSLTSFSGAWKGQSIGLLAPARIGFAQGVWVDKFRLGFRRAELTIAGGLGGGGEVQARGAARGKGGEAASALDVRATLAGLPADIVAIVAPDYAADGTIAGEVRLTGSASRPVGAVRVVASGLRLRSGAGRALPAADLSLGARLDGSSARLDGKLTAGPSSVILAGIAPLGISGRMDLHVDGTVDLAMVDPWLTAEGREARGQLDLALGVGGSLAAPRASGTVRLSNGEIQDAVLGLRVAGISAVFVADGDTVRVDRFDGKAGQGTISVSGTAGLMGMRPVNLTVRATDARILSSDRITAAADADLVLQGPLSGNPGPSGAVQTGAVQPGAVQPGAVQPGALVGRPAQVGTGRGEQGGQSPRGQSLPVQRLPGQSPREQSPAAPNQRTPIPPGLTLSGTVHLRRADIRVPEKLPASIAVLPVRDPEAPPMDRPPSAVMPDIGLNLTLDAPAEIFIRGRGIDAELGGRVLFAGTAARPLPQGGLTLRRGTFSIAGVSLGLTEGAVDFTGAGLVDPTLKLVATSTSATLTSTLTVGGEVKDPKIVLSSVPDLPQDEILSQLLFNTVKARLSPFQLAEIAAALASISGVGSPLGDPLESIRTKLGFDQLSVGTDATGGATLEAGRYIAKGVRIGAKQGTGGDTQAMVQIDIAKGLKLETTAGTGSSSATSTSGTGNGSSVGVTYQFEY